MRELGGGGFTVRPLSQFSAPSSAPAGAPAPPTAAGGDAAADSEADPRGNTIYRPLYPSSA
jgi:hypothetical protein